MPKSTSRFAKLPRQYTIGIIDLPDNLNYVAEVVTIVLVSSFVLNMILKLVLNQLLSSVVTIGLILHMFLVNVTYPLQLIEFMSILFELVTLDCIPTEKLYERIFQTQKVKEDGPLTDQFDLVGYSSVLIVKNIGSMFILLNFQIAVLIAAFFLQRLNFIWSKNKRIDAFTKQLFGSIIKFFKNNYMVLCTVTFIQLRNLRLETNHTFVEKFCSSLALLGVVFAIGFPVWSFWKLITKLRQLDPKLNGDKKVSEFIKNFKGTEKGLLELKQTLNTPGGI